MHKIGNGAGAGASAGMSADIFRYAVENGLLDINALRTQYEETERKSLLESFEYRIFESGGRWYCRLPGGKRIKRKKREDVENEIIRIQKERAEDREGKTPEELFLQWNESRIRRGVICGATALRYRKTCDKYIKNACINKKPVHRTSRNEWTAFLQEIYEQGSPTKEDPKRKLSAKELGRIKCVVKGILDLAEDEGMIDFSSGDVFSRIRTDKNGFHHKTSLPENEVYFPDEFRALKVYCLSHPDPYTRCILMAAITGERIGECAALRVEDIDLAGQSISVMRTETQADGTGRQSNTVREGAKTEKGVRRIAIPDSAMDWVSEVTRIARETGGGYLFKQGSEYCGGRYAGRRISTDKIRLHLKKICKETGIPYKPPHKLRKTYASILKVASVDDLTIIDQMGHTDISTTENVYLKSRSRMEERAERLGRITELQLDPGPAQKGDLAGTD